MPVDQILPGNRGHGLVLGYARVGILRPINQFGGFAGCDVIHVVVAAGDGVEIFLLGQVKLVVTKFGLTQQGVEDLEDIIEIAFQARPRNRSGVDVAAGFNFRRPDLEIVVELVSGLSLGAAGAPDFSVDVDQSGFGSGLGAGSAANSATPSISGSS